MVKARKIPITLKGQIAALLASGNGGSLGLILDDNELKAAIEREGSISAFAKRHGLERTQLTKELHGKRPLSAPLIKAMGLQKVYVPQRDRR